MSEPTKVGSDFWPTLEKAARTWARGQGLDEDEFIRWLKREASRKTVMRGTVQRVKTHAGYSLPED